MERCEERKGWLELCVQNVSVGYSGEMAEAESSLGWRLG